LQFEKIGKRVVTALENTGETGVADFLQTDKKKILYGAGKQGKNIFYLFWAQCKINIDALLYSSPGVALAINDILGKTFHIDAFPYEKDSCAVLVSVNEMHNEEITGFLRSKGFNHIYTAASWDNANKAIKSALDG
jgi:hypothetical protein